METQAEIARRKALSKNPMNGWRSVGSSHKNIQFKKQGIRRDGKDFLDDKSPKNGRQ